MKIRIELGEYFKDTIKSAEDITKGLYHENDIITINEMVACITDLVCEYHVLEEKYNDIINDTH